MKNYSYLLMRHNLITVQLTAPQNSRNSHNISMPSNKLLEFNSNKSKNSKKPSKTVNKSYNHSRIISSPPEDNSNNLEAKWKSLILNKQHKEKNLSWNTGSNSIKRTIKLTILLKSTKLSMKSIKLHLMISKPKMTSWDSIFWVDLQT